MLDLAGLQNNEDMKKMKNSEKSTLPDSPPRQ